MAGQARHIEVEQDEIRKLIAEIAHVGVASENTEAGPKSRLSYKQWLCN